MNFHEWKLAKQIRNATRRNEFFFPLFHSRVVLYNKNLHNGIKTSSPITILIVGLFSSFDAYHGSLETADRSIVSLPHTLMRPAPTQQYYIIFERIYSKSYELNSKRVPSYSYQPFNITTTTYE